MKPSKLVLDFLQEQGYRIERNDEDGIIFKAKNLTFIYMNNDESDSDFFQMALPGIYDVTEENREVVLEAANKNNREMKVAKTCVLNDSVWIFFEIFLDDTPGVSDFMSRAINLMMASRNNLYELLS